jgi:hypothetical protein
MHILKKIYLLIQTRSKEFIPRIDAITIMKSNTFHGIVKYLKFNAINFIPHSIANLNNHQYTISNFRNINGYYLFLQISQFYGYLQHVREFLLSFQSGMKQAIVLKGICLSQG